MHHIPPLQVPLLQATTKPLAQQPLVWRSPAVCHRLLVCYTNQMLCDPDQYHSCSPGSSASLSGGGEGGK